MHRAGRGGGTGPSTYTRIVEITSGTTTYQQGLVATCKDWRYTSNLSPREVSGGAHEPVGAWKEG